MPPCIDEKDVICINNKCCKKYVKNEKKMLLLWFLFNNKGKCDDSFFLNM